MSKFIDLTGQKFGKLTVVKRSYQENKKGTFWECICVCGKTNIIVKSCLLRSGKTKSCGCYNIECIKQRSTKHGNYRSLTYNSYESMKKRCYDYKTSSYNSYSGKGITVCERWLESFKNFLEDMGERPSKEYTLDRIDNSKGYYKENCRWATRIEQNSNKSNNITVIINDENLTLSEAYRKYTPQVSLSTIYRRYKKGWDIKRIFDIEHE